MSEMLTENPCSIDDCGIFVVPRSTNTHLRDQHDCLGGSNRQLHRYPHLESAAFRLKTFESWPVYLRPRPQAMADAGFFYLGVGDGCKCFSCGNSLRDWNVTDDPWTEHKRHFPECQFVIEETAKGRKPKNDSSVVLEPIETGIPEALLCKICFSRQMCMTFLPCKHVSSCASCASCLNKCPICQGKIESSFKVFLQ